MSNALKIINALILRIDEEHCKLLLERAKAK